MSELDLTPRSAPSPRRRRSPLALVVLAVVLVGLAVVLLQGLRNATVYYRNADEAVADRDSLGSRRFRLQGTVQEGITGQGERLEFTVAFNGVEVPVRYTGGEPSDLFAPCIPVVLEGHWDAEVFASDRILIKHTSTYEAENPDRLEPTGCT